MTYSQLLNSTSNMSTEDLIRLNSDLVALIKHRRKMASKDMARMLEVGDKVKLTDRSGDLLHGIVKKVMRTRAIVVIDGIQYKVPMSMLEFA